MMNSLPLCRKTVLTVVATLLLLLAAPLSAVTMDDAKAAARMRDYPKMARVLQQLANGGDAEAQYQLANLYRSGRGVNKDLKSAALWARKAANQGHPKAQYLLAGLCEKGVGCKSESEAKKLYASSAADGYSPAKERLANAVAPDLEVNANSEAQLRNAARRGDVAGLARLLLAGVAVDAADEHGRTALIEA
ncbi:MAG TPA: hypothetical protein VGB35_05820, partial [Gammaproteobacteria bacterium]